MAKQKLNSLSMSVKFENFQPIENTGFVKGECKVAYAGKNRNYSNIVKEAFTKAEPTIFGIPVVGNWLGDNYGGHDIILETKGNEVIMKDNTVPYGFVPKDANPRWVEVVDNNGNSKNYYTVDVILWKERYQQQVQFVIDNGTNQSMEIFVTDGDWDDNFEYFDIKDFYYSALCLLGKSIDESGEGHVEPCFEDSEVVINNFTMSDNFKKDLFAMKNIFKGGENLDKTEKVDVVEDEFVEDTNAEEEFSDKEINNDVQANDIPNTEKDTEKGNFELSYDDIRNKIFDVLNPKDEDGYRSWNYWIMELFQTYVMVSDENETEKYYKFNYSISEDDEITLSDKTEMFLTWLTKEEKDNLEQKESDFKELAEKYDTLAISNKELQEYKDTKEAEIATHQKNEVIEEYSLLLSQDDISIIEIDKDNYSLDELKGKLSQIFTEKELEKIKSKSKKLKDDETIIFDNKLKDTKVKKNKFAL